MLFLMLQNIHHVLKFPIIHYLYANLKFKKEENLNIYSNLHMHNLLFTTSCKTQYIKSCYAKENNATPMNE